MFGVRKRGRAVMCFSVFKQRSAGRICSFSSASGVLLFFWCWRFEEGASFDVVCSLLLVRSGAALAPSF